MKNIQSLVCLTYNFKKAIHAKFITIPGLKEEIIGDLGSDERCNLSNLQRQASAAVLAGNLDGLDILAAERDALIALHIWSREEIANAIPLELCNEKAMEMLQSNNAFILADLCKLKCA